MPNGGVVGVTAENFTIQEQSGSPLAPGRSIKVAIADAGRAAGRSGHENFGPYFTTKPTSSGLGLAICYSIITDVGFFQLESNTSAGATFTFYLSTARTWVIHDPRQPNDGAPERHQQRIVVRDDDAAIRDLTSQLLSTSGYEVTAVPDDSEAVHIYKRAQRKGEGFLRSFSTPRSAAGKPSNACAV